MQRLTSRLFGLFEAYGPVALATWWGLFLLTLGGFYGLVSFGFEEWISEDPASDRTPWGLLGVAYVGATLTRPLRIFIVLALTPLIAKVLGVKPPSDASDAEDKSPPPAGES